MNGPSRSEHLENGTQSWERPWTLEEMRQSSANWSLAADSGVSPSSPIRQKNILYTLFIIIFSEIVGLLCSICVGVVKCVLLWANKGTLQLLMSS